MLIEWAIFSYETSDIIGDDQCWSQGEPSITSIIDNANNLKSLFILYFRDVQSFESLARLNFVGEYPRHFSSLSTWLAYRLQSCTICVAARALETYVDRLFFKLLKRYLMNPTHTILSPNRLYQQLTKMTNIVQEIQGWYMEHMPAWGPANISVL